MTQLIKKWRHDSNFLIHEVTLARWVLFFLIVGIFAGAWDIWWHIAVGRESLFIAPHLLLYGATGLTILSGIYGWFKTREKLWGHLAIFLCFVPLLAPFDEAWHRMYGIEDLSTAMILWSPPHVGLALVYLFSFMLVYPLIHNKDESYYGRRLFSGLALASIANILFIIVSPFDPLGPYHVLGMWGASAYGFVLVAFMLAASRYLHGTGSATVVTAFFMLSYLIVSGNVEPAEGILIPFYILPPTWIQVAAFMSAAALIDVLVGASYLARGILGSALWAAIYFGVSAFFLPPEAGYTPPDAAIAIIASIIGGLVGAFATAKIFHLVRVR